MGGFIRVPNQLFDFIVLNPDQKNAKQQIHKFYSLRPIDLRVYVCLLACQMDGEAVIRKMATLSGRCQVNSRKTVLSAIRRLQKQGLLEIHKRINRYGVYLAHAYSPARLPGGYFKLDCRYLDAGLSSSEFCVLLYLLRCKNAGDRAFPSILKITQATGLSKNTVRASIHELGMRLYLRKEYRHTLEGDFGNNHYCMYSLEERDRLYAAIRKIRRKASSIFTVFKRLKQTVITACSRCFSLLRGWVKNCTIHTRPTWATVTIKKE